MHANCVVQKETNDENFIDDENFAKAKSDHLKFIQ